MTAPPRGFLLALLGAFGFAAALIGLELYSRGFRGDRPVSVSKLRAFADEAGRAIPDSEGLQKRWDGEGTTFVRINSLGLRGPNLQVPRPLRTRRILFLGDSVIFGTFVEENETIPARLEKNLSSFGSRVEVANAGFEDVGTEEAWDFLSSSGTVVEPDSVLLGFYLNDSRSKNFPSGYFRSEAVHAPAWIKALGKTKWLEGSSLWGSVRDYGERAAIVSAARKEIENNPRFAWVHPHSRARDDWTKDERHFEALVDLARFDWGAAWQEETWPNVFSLIGRIRDYCGRRGIPFRVVIFPVEPQLAASPDFKNIDKPQRVLMDWLNREGIPFLDLLPRLRRRGSSGMMFDHCHYTPMGAEFVADEISEFIRRSDLQLK